MTTPSFTRPAWAADHRLRGRCWRCCPSLNLAFPAGHPLHVSSYMVALVGKFMCYAMAALALDLVWGYTGILSLGHGVFFALGGYAHGMYLMRAIGREGVYQSDLPDFMVFLDWKTYPWFWSCTDNFWYSMLLVVAGAGRAGLRVRLLRVPLADQGRLLLDHHAGDDLRVHAAVLPQRHRLRRQQRLHRLQAHPRLYHHRAVDQGGAVPDHAGHAAGRAAAVPLDRALASWAACCRRCATPSRG